MKTSKKPARAATSRRGGRATSAASVETQVDAALAWLRRHATQRTRDGMARYGIPSEHALGVPMNQIQTLGKQLGRNQPLAAALWKTGCYEARLLVAFVAVPAQLTATQMEAWCRDFDNWAVVDTLCFKLFDRTPHAFSKVRQWHDRPGEFQKRAAFALLASAAGHMEDADDAMFLRCLPYIEHGARDERNFVKKGVSWALRSVGRRSAALNAAAVNLARQLTEFAEPSARWIGRDAFKELTSPKVQRRFAAVETR